MTLPGGTKGLQRIQWDKDIQRFRIVRFYSMMARPIMRPLSCSCPHSLELSKFIHVGAQLAKRRQINQEQPRARQPPSPLQPSPLSRFAVPCGGGDEGNM